MLTKIVIEGLRGFADKTEISFALPNALSGSGLTLLTGPNNSGKSTIIEAIKVKSGFHQLPSFHVGMRNAKTDSVLIEYEINGEFESLATIRVGSSETTTIRKSNLAPYVVPSRRQFSPYFGRSIAANRDQYAMQSGSHHELRQQVLSGFEGRLFELERKNTAFDALLSEVIPDFMNWSIDQNETGQYFVKLKSATKTHSLAGSGDGIISAFVIVAALFDSQPGNIIAIDEPELSLHPAIQRRLANVINRFAADRQIVVSTHSPYFVSPDALRNGAKIIRTWDRSGSIEVFEVSVSSCAGLSALLSPNANNPHVFGLDAREIFFSDDPILVFEGQEDVVFWPRVIVGHPLLADLPTYGWGAGGAANMKNVISVLKALGYRRVCGVLDNNRPQDVVSLRSSFPDFLFVEIPAADIRSKQSTPARAEVEGLLDHSGNIRADLKNELDTRLAVLEAFVDP